MGTWEVKVLKCKLRFADFKFRYLLSVRRVQNEIGPQIKPDYASTLNKLMGNTSAIPKIKQEPFEQDQHDVPHGLEERIDNIDHFLGINPKPAPRNLFERVKNLEDRLLYLESISPEYYHFIVCINFIVQFLEYVFSKSFNFRARNHLRMLLRSGRSQPTQ